MNIGGVYKITNIIDEECYIGSAVYFRRRKNAHWDKLRKNKHDNIHLQRAVNKYGIENFHFEILATCPKEYCIKLEQWFLDTMRPSYNICKHAGSTLGKMHSDESRAKMSASRKGVKLSDSHRENKRKAQIGRKLSDETKAKIGKANTGRYISDAERESKRKAHTGKKLSDSHRDCMKKAWLTAKHPQSKEVVNTLTGEIFKSAKAAADANGLNVNTLRGRLNGNLTNNTPYQYLQNPE